MGAGAEKKQGARSRSKSSGSKRGKTSSVKADLNSHLMWLGASDYLAGKLDAKPILCVGWLLFEAAVTQEQVREELESKLLPKVFRMRAVPVERDGWTYFDEVDALDWGYHLQRAGPFESHEAFESYLADLVDNDPLDYTKPCWRYIVVDGLPGDRFAVINVTDHLIGDGASQVSALLSMTEGGLNPVFAAPSPTAGKGSGRPRAKARALTPYEQLVALWTGISRPILEQILPADMPSKLKQPDGVLPKRWRFALTRPGEHVEVSKFKDIKDKVPGATVNDVMLAVTALAIKAYYLKIEDPLMDTDRDLRATYAVNARPRGADYLADDMFGNHIVVATTDYPMHRSRVDTLLAFRDSSRLKKSSPDTAVRLALYSMLGYLPRDQVIDMAVKATLSFSIMISNVCMSLKPLSLFGQEIVDSQFLAFTPQGMYCGAATYGDKVNFAVVTTEETGTVPADLLPYFKRELDALHDDMSKLTIKDMVKRDKPLEPPLWLKVGGPALFAVLAMLVLRLVL